MTIASDTMREEPSQIFDRLQYRRNAERRAPAFMQADFLFRESAARLAERLLDIRRRFPVMAELGAHHGLLHTQLPAEAGVEQYVETALHPALLPHGGVVADEEWLPFAPGSFDAIMSNLSMHWVNDLPGALVQIRQALKPDGLFLACFFGGETLKELRQSFIDAESAVSGGLSPHVSPFVDIRDAGALLQRAGFALPVVDTEILTVTYESAFRLMEDLRHMGEANALLRRRQSFTPRRVLLAMAERYQQRFGMANGRIPATFELVTLTGWAPHASQQQPARRGSGTASLAEIVGKEE